MNASACGAAQSLRARFQLPLGAIVHPLADPQDDVPVIQLGPAGIVRCKRCRTYINPFMLWQDGGRCAARPRRPPSCPDFARMRRRGLKLPLCCVSQAAVGSASGPALQRSGAAL